MAIIVGQRLCEFLSDFGAALSWTAVSVDRRACLGALQPQKSATTKHHRPSRLLKGVTGYTRPVRIRVAATILCACWWIAEYIRSSFRDKATTSNLDKGSSKLWDLGHFIGVIGIITGFTRAGRVQDGEHWISVCGFVLMLMGISIRWLAIHTLGHYFTGKVSTAPR